MNPLRPTRPDELATLLMENELLRYEVAHLRARLAAAQAAAGLTSGVTPADADAAAGPDPGSDPGSDAGSGPDAGPDLAAPVRRARAFFSGRHGAPGGDPGA